LNERIRELRKQAQKYVLDIPASLSPAEFDDLFEEKFSELIVRECAELCEGEAIFAGMNGRKDASASNCATIIRQHFGVAE
jgi:hypothetical protein